MKANMLFFFYPIHPDLHEQKSDHLKPQLVMLQLPFTPALFLTFDFLTAVGAKLVSRALIGVTGGTSVGLPVK